MPGDRLRSHGCAFPHDGLDSYMRVYSMYVCVCRYTSYVSLARNILHAHVCASVDIYTYILHDGTMRSARIVRAPAPQIIQQDDLPILEKQTGPMVTSKGVATHTHTYTRDDLIVLGTHVVSLKCAKNTIRQTNLESRYATVRRGGQKKFLCSTT